MIRKTLVCLALLLSMVASLTATAHAAEKATPQEVYEKVLEAAEVVEQLGEEGLAAISDTKEFIWKDSYVWAINCPKGVVAAHPSKKFIGRDISATTDKNPDESKRKKHNLELCDGASNAYGVWVEYWWERLEDNKPARKISFMIQVPGQPFFVTAGIYDDSTSVEELNASLKQ